MSGPTRGMVAGQAIQTQGPSKEYDEGFDRTFGERKRLRGKFVWDSERQEMVPVGPDWTDAERRAQTGTEELTHGNIRAPDGTDISSKRKRREYMHRAGVTDSSDFSSSWEKAAKERADFLAGGKSDPALRYAVGKAEYELSKRKKR
jgi:hypothetical protein